MSKLALVAAAAFLALTASARADSKVYELNDWPNDIDLIPCSAWEKMPDGGWALHATVRVGSSFLDNVGVKGDAAAHQLDRTCGAKAANTTDAAVKDPDAKPVKKKKKKEQKDQNEQKDQ